ncbi:hypothetical protein NP493_376g01049 [Ridgeia piscesae]|uniref:Uncharacterized protein n=1 Tax=Ridgeia piscesae TaxID=27915 RepID=A0AAD9NV64_RIDPI|nr:hypothetical protein NP493_376g01049 [Ridgeia piscesae]
MSRLVFQMECTTRRQHGQATRTVKARAYPTLLLIFCSLPVLLFAMPMTRARDVGFRAPACDTCDVSVALKSLKKVAVCNACGEMYGLEFERCCLCDKDLYVTCLKAIQ